MDSSVLGYQQRTPIPIATKKTDLRLETDLTPCNQEITCTPSIVYPLLGQLRHFAPPYEGGGELSWIRN
jgi:hypothetical protein